MTSTVIATTEFQCKHVTDVDLQIDDDITVPGLVRGLGKCKDCMNADNLIPISGVEPQANGDLRLDSIFWMPIE
jgi:hypothetical protein